MQYFLCCTTTTLILKPLPALLGLCFVLFSSAFNTIQPYILANKLTDFKLHNTTIAWIFVTTSVCKAW